MTDTADLLDRLDALSGCSVTITRLVNQRARPIDVGRTADEAADAIRSLIDELADANDRIEHLERGEDM